MSKVIAVIEKPKSCDECVWARCKYSLPLSTNRRGYYCQLKEPQDRVVEDFSCDEELHLSDCPLKVNYESEIRNKAIEEFAEKCNQKITEFILEHQNQITFVSGVSMGWKIIDEIAESMKGEKE